LVVIFGANVEIQERSKQIIDRFRKIYQVYDPKHEVGVTQKNFQTCQTKTQQQSP